MKGNKLSKGEVKRERQEKPGVQLACFSLSSWQTLRAKSSEAMCASWGEGLAHPTPGGSTVPHLQHHRPARAVPQGQWETACRQRAKPEVPFVSKQQWVFVEVEGSFLVLGVCWGCAAAAPLHQVSSAKDRLGLCWEPGTGMKAEITKWVAQ